MKSTKPPKTAGGKDLESFRAAHDKAYILPRRIQAALAALGDSWEYEVEFLKRSGVATSDIGAYREQFQDHWMEVRSGNRNVKRVWCGTVKFAEKLRATLT